MRPHASAVLGQAEDEAASRAAEQAGNAPAASGARANTLTTAKMSCLKRDGLVFDLGCFRHYVQGRNSAFEAHFSYLYDGLTFSGEVDQPAEHCVRVHAPWWLRRWLRPQVVASVGFASPVVPLPASMAALAFEMGMNLSVALTTFRLLVLHAGVLADAKDRSLLITAPSGGGKSTLTAHLMARGMRYLSDEFGLLSLDGKATLQPYPRPLSLKNASIDITREVWPHLAPTLSGSPRGDIAYARPSDVSRACSRPASAYLMVVPHFSRGAKASITPLSKAEAFMALVQSSPNYTSLGQASFEALTGYVQRVRAYKLTYGSSYAAERLLQDVGVQL